MRRVDPAVRDINNNSNQFPVMLTPRNRTPTQRFQMGTGTHDFYTGPANSRENQVEAILQSPDSRIPFRPRQRRRLLPPNFRPRENFINLCMHCLEFYPTHFFHTSVMHAHCAKKVICAFMMKYVLPWISTQNPDNMDGYFEPL